MRRNQRRVIISIVQILRIRSKGTPLPFPLKVAVYLASHLNLGPKFSEAFLDLRRARRHSLLNGSFLDIAKRVWWFLTCLAFGFLVPQAHLPFLCISFLGKIF